MVRVERRVEADEIDRLIFDVVPQDLQIVAVVESVHSRNHLAVAGGLT